VILRIFRAVVHEGQEEAFRRFYLHTALPLLRSREGLDSLRDFAGEDWSAAVIHPDEAPLLQETRVSHDELAESATGHGR
jgi:hypothetical protein